MWISSQLVAPLLPSKNHHLMPVLPTTYGHVSFQWLKLLKCQRWSRCYWLLTWAFWREKTKDREKERGSERDTRAAFIKGA